MSAGDLLEFFGLLFGAWSFGFCSGATITYFKRAVDAST